MKNILTLNQMYDSLDFCYEKALTGLSNTKSCYELAEEYMTKYSTIEKATREFTKWQITKCTASGFITGLGGVTTMPVSLPTNIVSTIYIQLRMIATIAIMNGYDPMDDRVQTLAYLCLTGSSATKILRDSGIKIAEKMTLNAIKKIPGAICIKINQKVGFRLVTKFGKTGIVNCVELLPVIGGFVGGGIDFAETRAIAEVANKIFVIDSRKEQYFKS